MSLNQGAREGRKGNMATQDGQGQSIKEPWEMNTEAETGSKLAKQCWEEHDSEVSARRQEGHPGDKNTHKDEMLERKSTKNYWK